MQIRRLILASTSPFRRELLRAAGMYFEPCAPTCDERQITAATARELALARARGKSASVEAENALVLGADQVLGFEDRALDKVSSRDEATARLRALAGKAHTLETAYALSVGGQVIVERVETATMRMRPLRDDEISAYLDSGEWEGSVGCYQYENRGGQLFEPGSPEMSLIVGLPIAYLSRDLRALGVDLLVNPDGPWDLTLDSAQG